MSSVLRFTSQPKTVKFVMTDDNTNEGYGLQVFLQSDVDAWLSANAVKLTNLDGLVVIPGVAPGATFVDVLTGQNGATALDSTTFFYGRKTFTDMGKEIVVGSAADSELLVLRLVKTPSNSQTGGDFIVGYIPVENNASDLGTTTGRFQVRVARV